MYLGKIAEYGTAEQIFSRPRHPYTQALLASTPHLNSANRQQRVTLSGELPSPLVTTEWLCLSHPLSLCQIALRRADPGGPREFDGRPDRLSPGGRDRCRTRLNNRPDQLAADRACYFFAESFLAGQTLAIFGFWGQAVNRSIVHWPHQKYAGGVRLRTISSFSSGVNRRRPSTLATNAAPRRSRCRLVSLPRGSTILTVPGTAKLKGLYLRLRLGAVGNREGLPCASPMSTFWLVAESGLNCVPESESRALRSVAVSAGLRH